MGLNLYLIIGKIDRVAELDFLFGMIFPFVVKKQLSKHDQEMTFESLCIECVIDNRKVLVCVVYRSPSASLREFLQIYERFIEDVTNLNSEQVLVMGDF